MIKIIHGPYLVRQNSITHGLCCSVHGVTTYTGLTRRRFGGSSLCCCCCKKGKKGLRDLSLPKINIFLSASFFCPNGWYQKSLPFLLLFISTVCLCGAGAALIVGHSVHSTSLRRRQKHILCCFIRVTISAALPFSSTKKKNRSCFAGMLYSSSVLWHLLKKLP